MPLYQFFLLYIAFGILTFILDDYQITVTQFNAETQEEIPGFSFVSICVYIFAFSVYVVSWPITVVNLILDNLGEDDDDFFSY